MAAAVVMARSMAGAVSRCWHSYVGLLDRYPARTVAVNTAVLMTSGDLIAQLVLEKRHRTRDFDSARTLRFFGVGLLLAGPTMHAWYVRADLLRSVHLRTAGFILLFQKFSSVYVMCTLTTWHCLQHLIDISRPPGPQQQTCSSGFAAVGPCWDRQTDGHCAVSPYVLIAVYIVTARWQRSVA